jgi:hypothetical protein
MIGRGALFLAWALIGAVLSYGALYALTPFGLSLIAASLLVALALPAAGGTRWPEAIGLLGGPGVFCLVVAASADEPAAWLVAGVGIMAAAGVAYALVGRARCAMTRRG